MCKNASVGFISGAATTKLPQLNDHSLHPQTHRRVNTSLVSIGILPPHACTQLFIESVCVDLSVWQDNNSTHDEEALYKGKAQ